MVLLKSKWVNLLSIIPPKSTFHYGSIKIFYCFFLLYSLVHLHSTMVLLKLIESCGTNITVFKSTFHYGSIKILERLGLVLLSKISTFHYGSIKISEWETPFWIINKSTFHYGSIKIKLCSFLMFLYQHLHSTMVLLKSLTFRENMQDLKNLHSTMVLLKFLITLQTFLRNTYLHSTMVLLKFTKMKIKKKY